MASVYRGIATNTAKRNDTPQTTGRTRTQKNPRRVQIKFSWGCSEEEPPRAE
jgi:hypothetical protein